MYLIYAHQLIAAALRLRERGSAGEVIATRRNFQAIDKSEILLLLAM